MSTSMLLNRFSSVRSKILGLVILAGVLPILVSVVVTRYNTGKLSHTINDHMSKSIDERISALNRIIFDMCKISDDELKPRVANGLALCKDYFRAQGGLSFSAEPVIWNAVNQFSKEVTSVRLPKMVVGGRWLGQVKDMNERVLIVDSVKELTGGACSLFQRMNAAGDMLRVASNVKMKDGTRGIGTYIPAVQPDGTKNPVLDSVLNGKTYSGRGFVVDSWYATSYDPIRDANGQIVGMTSFGIKQDESNSVRNSVLTKRIGKGGYVAIIGGNGAEKHRYIVSLEGKRDGEDIGGAKDDKGRFVIQEMVEKALSLSEGDVAFYPYDWKNKGEAAPRQKIAAICYFKPWDWVILSTAYLDELNESTNVIKDGVSNVVKENILFGLVGLGIVLVIAFWLSSNTLARPLARLVEVSEKIAQGDVQHDISVQSNDEIGRLANAFRGMIGYLKALAASAQSLGQGDTSATVTPKSDKDVLSQSMGFALKQVGGLVDELNGMTVAIKKGQLSRRGQPDKFQGGYREIVDGFNNTLDAVIAPVQDATAVLERVADKDMTARVTGTYQGDHARIKDAVNAAAETLDQSLQQVAVGSDQIASAAGQIGTGAQSLAQGTSQQASSLEEVSSSLQEMNAMTRQNAANAKEARGIAEATKTSAENGVGSMQRLSSAMDLIKKSSDDTAKIIKTIDEIAFQTNLLALNAAVEAARAGEAGKGFAVVAEEVRNLAMRSAEAAKNTADMIEGSVKNAENGVTINQEVMKNLEEINGHAKRVSEVMAEIAAASDQQSQGVGQVNTAMEQMNQLTQQNAANSEESASASEELSAQAQEMKSMVSGFKIGGGHSSPLAPTSKAVSRASAKPAMGSSRPTSGKSQGKPKGDNEDLFPLEAGAGNGVDALKDF
jgi:methyl-accepting chemotaxis protein